MAKFNCIKTSLVEHEKNCKWLAEQVGRSECVVCKWCSNSVQPDLKTLEQIAQFIRIDRID